MQICGKGLNYYLKTPDWSKSSSAQLLATFDEINLSA